MKKIIFMLYTMFLLSSILGALTLTDLRRDITGINPTPKELNNYIFEKCKENNIPPIILKAILLKEGQAGHKWQQYSPDSSYSHDTIVFGTDIASYGLGLFQVTYKVDNNKVFLSGYNSSEIKRVVSDWKFNVDKAVEILLSKWKSNVGSFTGIDTNPLIIENWYYAIAWYNGSGTYAKNYVDYVYKYMKDSSSVKLSIGNSNSKDEIYGYYQYIPNISMPYIISGFTIPNNAITGSGPTSYTLKEISDNGGELHIWNKESSTSINVIYDKYYYGTNLNNLTRAKALKLILDKFEISTKNAGFNQSRFSEPISLPSDVTNSTDNYDAIVVGYNRGITNGSNGKFNPTNAVSLQEFLTMIVRAVPIPLTNPNYQEYNYMSSGDGFYKYVKTAYNAKIIENKEYNFSGGIDEDNAKELLNKAFEYFRGANSGISVYLKWNQKYADLDMYAFSEADAGGIQMDIDSNRIVTNMSELKASGAIVYWNKYNSTWGTNLDYDSWGGNANQPWAGFGEERITVDSLMARRPGTYSFIICNYDWGNSSAPSSPNYELIGYQGATNITSGGTIKGTISKSKCVLGGTLSTN